MKSPTLLQNSLVPNNNWYKGVAWRQVQCNTRKENPRAEAPMQSKLSLLTNPGPWFEIKMSSYQYRNSHRGDKTILRPSYLHNGISFTGKMASLYWMWALGLLANWVLIALVLDFLFWYCIALVAKQLLCINSCFERGYSAAVFQALQVIVLVVFGTADKPIASYISVQFLEI